MTSTAAGLVVAATITRRRTTRSSNVPSSSHRTTLLLSITVASFVCFGNILFTRNIVVLHDDHASHPSSLYHKARNSTYDVFITNFIATNPGPTPETTIDNGGGLKGTANSTTAAIASTPTSSDSSSSNKTYYSYLRRDQSGWAIMDMLKAHSFTFERGATYGGACGESSHRNDVQAVLRGSGLDRILPLPQSADCPKTNNQTHIMYHSSFYEKGSADRLKSPAWISYVRSRLNLRGSHDDGGVLNDNNLSNSTKTKNVVVHIRRRDVTPCCYPFWYVPNAYFEAMIEKYSAVDVDNVTVGSNDNRSNSSRSYHNIRVHIYSQSDSFESWTPFQKYIMHLDEDVGDVWKAILAADIFIGSKSEFSKVPSMFTLAQVVAEFETWPMFRNESAKVFANCTEGMIFSCKNKWFLNKRKKKSSPTKEEQHPQ